MTKKAKSASPEVLASLGAYIRRSARSTEDWEWVHALDAGRLRDAPSSAESFRLARLFTTSEATRTSDEAAPGTGAKQAQPVDPRIHELRSRYPVVRAPIVVPQGALGASEVSPEEVRARLERLRAYVLERVRAGELPSIDLPDLHRANAIYDERGNVFLGQNVRRLAFDGHGGKAFAHLLLTLEAALDNIGNRLCMTKRGLYYLHQAKFPDANASQIDTDRALAALASLVGVRRQALGFVEARRGSIYGRLVMRNGGQVVDVAKLGAGGYAVPRFTDDSEIVSSDAAFILVVEKHSVAFRLAQAGWCETARCILVCGEGFPSLSTREFVCTLVDTLGIPAMICVDGDPAGIQVALTYAHGSISTALETPWVACNNLWLAGIQPSDFDRYFGSSALIPLGDADRETARRMLEHPSEAHVNKRVREELAILVDRGVKGELDALANDTSRFIEDYLPTKLFESELVKL